MPLFEFTCRHCGHQFETFVTATRQPLCPKCQSTELEKLFSTFAAHGSTRTERGGAGASRFT